MLEVDIVIRTRDEAGNIIGQTLKATTKRDVELILREKRELAAIIGRGVSEIINVVVPAIHGEGGFDGDAIQLERRLNGGKHVSFMFLNNDTNLRSEELIVRARQQEAE